MPVRLLALALAVNYFFFHAELSEEEYLRNNPLPSDEPTVRIDPLSWETFGKTDATGIPVLPRLAPLHAVARVVVRRMPVAPSRPPIRLHEGRAPPVGSTIPDC